ncbi:MAG: peroxiredoxin [Alphaproteobacteria bacterium]|jgi:glutaredoxin/glutathione-dependent peroxiredoxin
MRQQREVDMTIKVGDKVATVELFRMGDDGPEAVSSDVLFSGRRVALFGVPGAFTRTCSARHLPGFVENADAIKAKGVDEMMCLAVNDAAVLAAWSREHGAEGKVLMVGDGCLNFTRAAGLEVNLSAKGYGPRCRRFSMVLDDGVVTQMYLEDGGFGETSAEKMLSGL